MISPFSRPSRALGSALLACLAGFLSAPLSCLGEDAPVPTEITSTYFESVSAEKEMRTLFSGNVVVTATGM